MFECKCETQNLFPKKTHNFLLIVRFSRLILQQQTLRTGVLCYLDYCIKSWIFFWNKAIEQHEITAEQTDFWHGKCTQGRVQWPHWKMAVVGLRAVRDCICSRHWLDNTTFELQPYVTIATFFSLSFYFFVSPLHYTSKFWDRSTMMKSATSSITTMTTTRPVRSYNVLRVLANTNTLSWRKTKQFPKIFNTTTTTPMARP